MKIRTSIIVLFWFSNIIMCDSS